MEFRVDHFLRAGVYSGDAEEDELRMRRLGVSAPCTNMRPKPDCNANKRKGHARADATHQEGRLILQKGPKRRCYFLNVANCSTSTGLHFWEGVAGQRGRFSSVSRAFPRDLPAAEVDAEKHDGQDRWREGTEEDKMHTGKRKEAKIKNAQLAARR